MKGVNQLTRNKIVFTVGLAVFTILNFFSASTMELHFDEAYYWIWSRNTSFGYFDHPPMIAWLIKAGQLLFNGELGVRFFIVILSSLSMIVIWRMIRRYSADALLFWALIYSVCIIQPYSFIATPDAPLFFFGAVFFAIFSRYLEKDNFQNAVLLAFIIALMIYSKYHAFLLIGLVVLFDLKLLKRVSFWLIILLTLVYLFPHIFWQVENNLPSFRYHLFESHKDPYSITVTLRYIYSEIALTGPFLGWLFLYILFSIKPDNRWEKSLKYTGAGIFVFFLLSTFGGDFEAHWILIAIIPLLILSYKFIIVNPKWQKWVMISGATSFVLLLSLRIFILTPAASHIKAFRQFSGNKQNAQTIKQFAGNTPVLFQDDWIDATLYSYYTNNSNIGTLNSGFYRQNQFDILDTDESFVQQSVLVLTTDSMQFANADKIKIGRRTLYGKRVENFRGLYNLKMSFDELSSTSINQNIKVSIKNPYLEAVKLGDDYNSPISFQLCTRKNKKWIVVAEKKVDKIEIAPENSCSLMVNFNLSPEQYKTGDIYLMLKIGELNPIPSKCLLNLNKIDG